MGLGLLKEGYEEALYIYMCTHIHIHNTHKYSYAGPGAHTFNPSICETDRRISEFEATLVLPNEFQQDSQHSEHHLKNKTATSHNLPCT